MSTNVGQWVTAHHHAQPREGPPIMKTERLAARVTPAELDTIKRAAELEHLSPSAFMVRSALREADEVLTRADVTYMPPDQFQQVMATLDIPDEAPRLAQAFRENRLTDDDR